MRSNSKYLLLLVWLAFTLTIAMPVQILGDLAKLSTKAALQGVCGTLSTSQIESMVIPNVDVEKSAPTVCRFVIANPKAFWEKTMIAKSYGVDFSMLDPSMPLTDLAALLPVIYVADVHQEYGTLGYMLNKASGKSMNDLKPELKSFRDRPVYFGGVQNRGSSFTMLHRKQSFPDNRVLRYLPGEPSFRLFFSPDLAMANELCLTKDAKPNEFRFFQWATVWLPKQLDLEYEQKMWLTIKAPADVIFEDESPTRPLWRRLVASLPPSRLGAGGSNT